MTASSRAIRTNLCQAGAGDKPPLTGPRHAAWAGQVPENSAFLARARSLPQHSYRLPRELHTSALTMRSRPGTPGFRVRATGCACPKSSFRQAASRRKTLGSNQQSTRSKKPQIFKPFTSLIFLKFTISTRLIPATNSIRWP